MQRITILLLSMLFCLNLRGQEAKPLLKEGSVMTYRVKAGGSSYDFIVTPTQLSAADGPHFKWEMTAPVNRSGNIAISTEADLSSYRWYNYFSSGDLTLESQTSVFISQMLSLDLSAAKVGDNLPKPVSLNGTAFDGEVMTVAAKDDPYTYTEGGQSRTINTVLIKTADGKKFARIYNREGKPFIVSMSIGFEIALQSIQ